MTRLFLFTSATSFLTILFAGVCMSCGPVEREEALSLGQTQQPLLGEGSFSLSSEGSLPPFNPSDGSSPVDRTPSGGGSLSCSKDADCASFNDQCNANAVCTFRIGFLGRLIGPGVCAAVPKPNGSPCNDRNLCTQVDSCQQGTCVGSKPKTCNPLDACHGAGACYPALGRCFYSMAADGKLCEDKNACTQPGTCESGSCECSPASPEDQPLGSTPVVNTTGYELYFNGVLQMQQLTWSRSQAASNCEWNINAYPYKHVDCLFNENRLGYEVTVAGQRVVYSPSSSKADAIYDCAINLATYQRKGSPLVFCEYDEKPVRHLTTWPDCGGVPTVVVRTQSGNCEEVPGWVACALDPAVPVDKRLCVYTWPEGVPSARDMAALDARARDEESGPHLYYGPRPVCGENRPSCGTSVPVTEGQAESCDPNQSSACCSLVGHIPWWDTGEECIISFDMEGESGCSCCAFGIINGRELTVVLDPSNVSQSSYIAKVFSTSGQPYALTLTPPADAQVFTVTVDQALQDGGVWEIE